eukprot:TRINITY_DN9934_c0_g1_i5.p1 TRINITY_DN9934_c0_g1~~TRINITY_DN9934_c0_g1_i5.p1  ORF type:complete len:971 (-),score=274.25 TRINITY_DN9934_c0_g1_i5:445-3357(-)
MYYSGWAPKKSIQKPKFRTSRKKPAPISESEESSEEEDDEDEEEEDQPIRRLQGRHRRKIDFEEEEEEESNSDAEVDSENDEREEEKQDGREIFIGEVVLKAYIRDDYFKNRFEKNDEVTIKAITDKKKRFKDSEGSSYWVQIVNESTGAKAPINLILARVLYPLLTKKIITLKPIVKLIKGKYKREVFLKSKVWIKEGVIKDAAVDVERSSEYNAHLKKFGRAVYLFFEMLSCPRVYNQVRIKTQTPPDIARFFEDYQRYVSRSYTATSKLRIAITEKMKEIPPEVRTETAIADVFDPFRRDMKQELVSKPSQMKTDLFDYQQEALTWMLAREKGNDAIYPFLDEESLSIVKREIHPLWSGYEIQNSAKVKPKIYINTFDGRITMTKPLPPPLPKGGILADGMGLGKTVMLIALILSNPWVRAKEGAMIEEKESPKPERRPASQRKRRATQFDDSDSPDIAPRTKRTKTSAEPQKATPKFARRTGANIETPPTTVSAKKPQSESPSTYTGGTLVVVPPTLLQQWEREITLHTKYDTLSVYVYHGNQRGKDEANLGRFDVILTTYGVVSNEYAPGDEETKGESGESEEETSRSVRKTRKIPSQLFNFKWWRVVLDEAHYIKTWKTRVARAVRSLEAGHRWALTGTPVQNKLDDIFSLLKFLRFEPWDNFGWWSRFVKHQASNSREGNLFAQKLLRPVMLRRTKASLRDGRSSARAALPTKNEFVHHVKLSKEEHSVYLAALTTSRRTFAEFLEKGTFFKNYLQIIGSLTRVRLVCDHAALVAAKISRSFEDRLTDVIVRSLVHDELRGKEGSAVDQKKLHEAVLARRAAIQETELYKNTMKSFKEHQLEECPICIEPMEDIVMTVCLHAMCQTCVSRLGLDQRGRTACPFCKRDLTSQDLVPVPRCNQFEEVASNGEFKRSSKLIAVTAVIDEALKKKEKVVVFSQFIGMLDFLEKDMALRGIKALVSYY